MKQFLTLVLLLGMVSPVVAMQENLERNLDQVPGISKVSPTAVIRQNAVWSRYTLRRNGRQHIPQKDLEVTSSPNGFISLLWERHLHNIHSQGAPLKRFKEISQKPHATQALSFEGLDFLNPISASWHEKTFTPLYKGVFHHLLKRFSNLQVVKVSLSPGNYAHLSPGYHVYQSPGFNKILNKWNSTEVLNKFKKSFRFHPSLKTVIADMKINSLKKDDEETRKVLSLVPQTFESLKKKFGIGLKIRLLDIEIDKDVEQGFWENNKLDLFPIGMLAVELNKDFVEANYKTILDLCSLKLKKLDVTVNIYKEKKEYTLEILNAVQLPSSLKGMYMCFLCEDFSFDGKKESDPVFPIQLNRQGQEITPPIQTLCSQDFQSEVIACLQKFFVENPQLETLRIAFI